MLGAAALSMTDAPEFRRPASETRAPAIAVIGAGFSGTLLTLHLLRRCPAEVRVHLIERNGSFGRGLAYATGNPSHLLNVAAGRMSAFSDRPAHFLEWLREDGAATIETSPEPGSFVPRQAFGAYIRHLLSGELKSAGKSRLALHRGEVTRLRLARDGVALQLDQGRRLRVDTTVLAVGNFPPEAPSLADPSFYHSAEYRPDPWDRDTLTDLDRSAPVLLIGTGLTMVDIVMSLLDQGHTGPIHALSRRGLVPHRHVAGSAAGPLLSRPLPTEITRLAQVIREEIAGTTPGGGDWRAIIDGLRPALQEVWQAMDWGNRARFVRHLRPWWDIHRHRMAPAVADRIDRARDAGQLRILGGRIRRFERDGATTAIVFRPRGTADEARLHAARVINCSGPGCDFDRISDALVRRLLKAGTVRPDPLRLGLDVTPQCALFNERGEISRRLYAVGPVTKAAFWEMTSVPDIRRQCELLATHLAGLLASSASDWRDNALRSAL
jgi:uncharacterized NAD(P)/FAD-binding protein YdhS